MQNYHEITINTQLRNSLSKLLGNTKTVMSNSSGDSFPASNLETGMNCYRTDQKKLYGLLDDTSQEWKLIFDLSKTPTNQEYVEERLSEELAKKLNLGQKAADAALLNGASESTSATADTIIKRDSNGDASARSFRSDLVNEDLEIGMVMTQVNLTDGNQIRSSTPEYFRSKVTDPYYLGKTAKAADSSKLSGKGENQLAIADTIASRDGDGDLSARAFKSSLSETNTNIGFIMTQVNTGDNNQIKPATPAQFRASILDAHYLKKTAKAADSEKVGGQTLAGLVRNNYINYMADGDLVFVEGHRDKGVFGTYDSYKTQHIWSIGVAYRNSPTGANFGNLYGLAYKHTNNSTGGTMAGGHQLVFTTGGTPRCAMGSNLWTSGEVVARSDARVKTDLEIIPNSLEKVQKLNGYTYSRLDAADKTERRAGVIAQEVLAVLPEAVLGGPTDEDPENYYSVAYGNMVALLIEAIKEQQTQIDEIKSLVA